MTLRLRDVETGYTLSGATVAFAPLAHEWTTQTRKRTNEFGVLRLTLPGGTYRLEYCAPGYMSMRSHATISPGENAPNTVNLDPITPPAELRPEVLDAKTRPGYLRVFGYVVDGPTGRPLPNVRVRLRIAAVQDVTNSRGYYEIFAPLRSDTEEKRPAPDDLTAQLPGYITYVDRNVDITGTGWLQANIELEGGTGIQEAGTIEALRRTQMQIVAPSSPPPPLSPELMEWVSSKPKPCPP